MRSRLIVAGIVLFGICFSACSSKDPEERFSRVRRAVEIVGPGFEVSQDCRLMGPVEMPAQDLSSLGGVTGGAEVDFVHDLTRMALRMSANLVVPTTGISAEISASSGQAFSGDAYHCPR